MNPKHLTPPELVRIVDGLDLGPVATPWIEALASALEDEIGASEDMQRELNEQIGELERFNAKHESAIEDAIRTLQDVL